MITTADVRRALNGIADPCARIAGTTIGLDDFGLVRSVEMSPEGDVRLVIAVTGPGCMYATMFMDEARRRVAALSGVSSVEVTLDTSYAWTEADMSNAARARLCAAHTTRVSNFTSSNERGQSKRA